jgi:ABC-type multidrug transport system fused ATPase/permease subunit
MDILTINRIVFEYIKQNPIMFIIYCVTIAAMPITDVILPHYYGKIINGLQEKKSIQQYILPLVCFVVIVQVFIFTNDILETVLYPRMHEFIRRYCLDFIVDGVSTDIQDMEIGKILAKMIRFAPMLYNYIDVWKREVIPYCLIYIFIIIYLSFYDFYLALLITISTVLIIGLTFRAMFTCVGISQKRDRFYNQIYEEVDEILRNMVSVLNCNNYEYENERLHNIEQSYKGCAMNSLLCSSKYKIFFLVVFCIILVLFVFRVMYLYKNKILTNATLISIFIIMLFLFNKIILHCDQFKDLMFRYGTIIEALSFFHNAIINKETNKTPNTTPVQTDYCLIMHQITYLYKGKQSILNNLNLYIECKQNIAIIGHIGCGKSTILKLLMKYIIPTQGTIYLNGLPYDSLSEKDIRKHIGYIQQSGILFNRSLMENIKYGKRDAKDEEVYSLINKLNLEEFMKRFPNGLKTIAGKNGSNLSGGEKQIIWILRILLQDPQIILLDEPTSAMDDDTKDELLNLLIRILKEKTVICVTHDNDILKYFHKIYEIKNGIANEYKLEK